MNEQISEAIGRPDFAAAFTDEDIQRLETIAQQFGINRRSALAVMARSADYLINAFSKPETEDALIESIGLVGAYINHLKAVTAVMESAQARLLLVGQYLAEPDCELAAEGAPHAGQ